ncbi:MAG: DNA topoisomerase (ATP-hydrolyzing) subunit B [Clostridiales bacterium]|nr:DNA topoisomerase (ATP-hydrolyzing) subunit B [Clostridiales bacterium]
MQNNEIAQNVYDESNIQVLEGLEPVRLRPGMYIGSTDKRGLHHLVYEIVDNSIDEAMGGYCSKIIVNINKDGSVSITDDGRGIPCGIHPTAKISALEVALTKLHSGGKFDANSYKVSGGLHGVGLAVVNALSEHMTATIKREGKIHQQKYSRGETLTGVEIIGETEETGTKIEFKPDAQIFDSVDFEYDTLRRRLREMAFLNNGIDITLRDEREEPVKSNHYCYEGGLKSFVENLNRNKEPLTEDTIYIKSDDGTYTVELAMQYNEGYSENIHTYANNISTHEGGTHETGFRSALTKVINEYARKINVLKPADENLSGEDVREGLTAILSVKLPNPQFEGQTKTKLGNSRMRPIVDTTVTNGLRQYLEENPKSGRTIVEKVTSAMRAREAARRARDLSRKKNERHAMPSKLADCTSKNVAEREIFIVEGDSAGGSAKGGRDRHFQAILPLRGKILNVEKTRFDKALANAEIRAMITAFGTGFGNDFDINGLRYDKIIIMTDADVDGSHIRILLLTFLFRYMRPLVEAGHVYIAQPPLFMLKKGKKQKYVFSDEELKESLVEFGEGTVVQRFKGLGEMDADQLCDTTMDPKNRILLQVTVDNLIEADEIFTMLMGDEVEPRKDFITKNSKLVADLDI